MSVQQDRSRLSRQAPAKTLLEAELGVYAYKANEENLLRKLLRIKPRRGMFRASDLSNLTKISSRLHGCIMCIQGTRWIMRLGGRRPESNCSGPAEPRPRQAMDFLDKLLLLLVCQPSCAFTYSWQGGCLLGKLPVVLCAGKSSFQPHADLQRKVLCVHKLYCTC